MKSLVIAREGHKAVTNDLSNSGKWEMVRLAEGLAGRLKGQSFLVMCASTRHVAQSAYIVSEVLEARLHVCEEFVLNGNVLTSCRRALRQIKKIGEPDRVSIVMVDDQMAPLLVRRACRVLTRGKKLKVAKGFLLKPGDAAVIDLLASDMSVLANR